MGISRTRFTIVFSVVWALSAAGRTAKAGTIYSYTGQPYSQISDFCNGTYTANCSSIAVAGSFTTASPLGDDLNNYAFTPESFSFTDRAGVITLTSTDALAISTFMVSTDADGNIVDWSISLANMNSDCAANVSGSECLGTYSNFNGAGDYSAYAFNLNTPSQVFGAGGNADSPGTWVESSAPEPYSAVLLAWGLLGLLAVRAFRAVLALKCP